MSAATGKPGLPGWLYVLFLTLMATATDEFIIAGVLAAAGPASGMTALALNISGLYLGTGVAGAVGGAVISTAGIRYVPLVATALMTLSFLLTLLPAAAPRGQRSRVISEKPTLGHQ